jgi:hypothetical protein
VRVKVYGLFARTRRRYLIDAAIGVVFGLILLVVWWLGWPTLRERLTKLELPPFLKVTVAVLDQTPWILLAAALWKGTEAVFVLRSFARKEAANRAKNSTPLT